MNSIYCVLDILGKGIEALKLENQVLKYENEKLKKALEMQGGKNETL